MALTPPKYRVISSIYFYSLFVFSLALRARQNTAQLVKYTAILHTETSNKIYELVWSLRLTSSNKVVFNDIRMMSNLFDRGLVTM